MKFYFLLLIFLTTAAFSQHNVEMFSSTLKSLTPDEVKGYVEGSGMGQAKVAELNGYPGPMHLLERKDELKLTSEQVRSLEELKTRMTTEAIKYGTDVIEAEKQLNKLFAGGNATEEQVRGAVVKSEESKANVRYAHLKAHLASRRILTPSQLKAYYAR